MVDQGGAVRKRTGEKFGWIGGWLGGFLWLLLFALLRLVQGRTGEGIIGLSLFVVAAGAIFFLAPWRHPSVRMWRLMLPVFLVLFVSIAWLVWTWDNPEQTRLSWWSFFWLLPCLIPFWTIGGKRWDGGR